MKSNLGYLLSGQLPVRSSRDTAINHIMILMVSPPAVHDIKRFWKLEFLCITTTPSTRIILRTTKKPVSHSKTVVIWPDYHVSQTIPIAHKLRFSHETNREHHTATARIPIYSANTVRSSKTKRRKGLKNEFHTQKIALNV